MTSTDIALMFTDIESSTQHLLALGDAGWVDVLAAHQMVVRKAIQAHGGREVKTEGDSFFVTFADASRAVAAAVDLQLGLAARSWPDGGRIRVRVGVHSGEPVVVGDDFAGLAVHEAARLADAGHGGQVLVSAAAQEALQTLPDEVSLNDLGPHALRDLPEPHRIYQVSHPGLQDAFPPLRTPSAVAHNLPGSVTSLVGRDAEIEAAMTSLAEARLITLVGPGGMGKTRVAVEVASRCLTAFADGVWFVPLAHLQDPGDLLAAISAVVGVIGKTSEEAGLALQQRLRGKSVLLVLDGFEAVQPAAATVAALLSACPDVKVIVTSRQPVRVSGERLLVVPALQPAAALQLLLARASDADPAVAADVDLVAALRTAQSQLGGIPLAIELTAARGGDGLWQLVQGGSPSGDEVARPTDLPLRQESLHATLAWSYQQLSPAGRRAFTRLSVFEGSGPSGAVMEVLTPDGPRQLAELVDCGLVTSLNGRTSMLDPVREFARATLADGPDEIATVDRHARWFAGVAAGAADGLMGADQLSWLQRLVSDEANLLAALSHLLESDPPVGQAMAGHLGRFWEYTGRWELGARWLRRALQVAMENPATEAVLHYWSGRPALCDGDFDAAARHQQQALAYWLGCKDLILAAAAENGLGELDRLAGRLVEAAQHCQSAHQLATAAGSERSQAVAELNLGGLAVMRGDLREGADLLEGACAVFAKLGDLRSMTRATVNLGHALTQLEDYEAARDRLEWALTQSRALGDMQGEAGVLANLAIVFKRLGFDRLAAGLLGDALRIQRQLGNRAEVGKLLLNLDRLDLATPSHWREALEIHRDAGNQAGVGRFAAVLGVDSLSKGHLQQARTWLDEAIQAYVDTDQPTLQVGCLLHAWEVAVQEGNRDREQRALRDLADALAECTASGAVVKELLQQAAGWEQPRLEMLLLGTAQALALPIDGDRKRLLRTVLGGDAADMAWEAGLTLTE